MSRVGLIIIALLVSLNSFAKGPGGATLHERVVEREKLHEFLKVPGAFERIQASLPEKSKALDEWARFKKEYEATNERERTALLERRGASLTEILRETEFFQPRKGGDRETSAASEWLISKSREQGLEAVTERALTAVRAHNTNVKETQVAYTAAESYRPDASTPSAMEHVLAYGHDVGRMSPEVARAVSDFHENTLKPASEGTLAWKTETASGKTKLEAAERQAVGDFVNHLLLQRFTGALNERDFQQEMTNLGKALASPDAKTVALATGTLAAQRRAYLEAFLREKLGNKVPKDADLQTLLAKLKELPQKDQQEVMTKYAVKSGGKLWELVETAMGKDPKAKREFVVSCTDKATRQMLLLAAGVSAGTVFGVGSTAAALYSYGVFDKKEKPINMDPETKQALLDSLSAEERATGTVEGSTKHKGQPAIKQRRDSDE